MGLSVSKMVKCVCGDEIALSSSRPGIGIGFEGVAKLKEEGDEDS